MSRFRTFASWQETAELESDSLDAADAWARAILADHPAASVYVAGDDFTGSWFTPSSPRSTRRAPAEHEQGHR